jgi:hypothetical protein
VGGESERLIGLLVAECRQLLGQVGFKMVELLFVGRVNQAPRDESAEILVVPDATYLYVRKSTL